MERDLTSITRDIDNVFEETRNYIINTPHALFYWIKNDQVKEFIEENPNSYDDEWDLEVSKIVDSKKVIVELNFYLYGESVCLERYCDLGELQAEAEENWAKTNGNVNKLRITEIEEYIKWLRKQLAEEEKKLERLKEE